MTHSSHSVVRSGSALSPLIEQCGPDGERHSWPRPIWNDTRCGYCGKPIGLEDCVSVFSDWPTRISYPDEHCPDGVRAVLEHVHCGPDVGYWFTLKRLARDGLDGPAGWIRHLNEKPWFDINVAHDIEAAYELAVTLQKGAQSVEPKPALPTKPYTITQRPSRISDNPRSISTRTRTRILERDNFRCRRCGAGPSDARLVIDHVVPVAKGGTADESNLQTLCHPCNSAKSDREPHQHDLKDVEGRGG